MDSDNYSNSIYWLPVMINSHNTGYMISNTGFLRIGDKIVTEPYITFDNKIFHVNIRYLVASAFIPNPCEHGSVTRSGPISWYTDKEMIRKSIEEISLYKKKHPEFTSKEDRVSKACELMSNPEMRLSYVRDITGISDEELNDIRCGDKWNDISIGYVFPINNYEPDRGIYTDDQIREVCKMLSSDKSFKQLLIQRITGVNSYTITLIRSRRLYKRISMYYEFCPTTDSSIYTNQQVRHACYMMENTSYEYPYIAKFCNVSIDDLYKIRDRKIYSDISKDFNTMGSCSNTPYEKRIMDLISSNITTGQIASMIQLEFNIKDRKEILNTISNIKDKYFNVNSSTTMRKQ